MSVTPGVDAHSERVPETVAALRDELAERRAQRAETDRVAEPLTESDREGYELRLDAYEVRLAESGELLADYASQLDVAHHDGLTGVWLRHAGQQLFEAELQRADRQATPLSIAFVDVDGLKGINDRLGHSAGDDALVTVARALLVGLRGYDHVVRWGGDEFLCILTGVAEAEATRRLRQTQLSLAAASQPLAISVGVAERTAGETPEQLVSRADQALYVSRGRRLRD